MTQIYYYSATWCSPCRTFGPIVDRVMNERNQRYTKIVLDQEGDDAIKRALVHQVRDIPMLVKEVDGVVVDALVGAHSHETVQAFLEA